MKTSPFKRWLYAQQMTVPQFVEEARKRGIITASVDTIHRNVQGTIPRNRVLYERAFPGIKF